MQNSQTRGSEKVGWVRIHRKIEEWEFYFSEPFTYSSAWMDLILLANHVRSSFLLRGNIVVVERGELARSEQTLASRWQWSRDKVRRFLAMLKTRQQIEIRKSAIISKIFLPKYDEMQSNDTTDQTTEKQQKNNRRYTYKNDKNVNNEKKEREGRFAPPSLEEVKSYCQERLNQINPQSFIDFYSSKGWFIGKNPMKDWKACVRTWEQRDSGKVVDAGRDSGKRKAYEEEYYKEHGFLPI